MMGNGMVTCDRRLKWNQNGQGGSQVFPGFVWGSETGSLFCISNELNLLACHVTSCLPLQVLISCFLLTQSTAHRWICPNFFSQNLLKFSHFQSHLLPFTSILALYHHLSQHNLAYSTINYHTGTFTFRLCSSIGGGSYHCCNSAWRYHAQCDLGRLVQVQ